MSKEDDRRNKLKERGASSWREYRINLILQREPYRYHSPGSPYLGLTLKEQRALSKLRRGKTKTPVELLRKQRKATRQDYINLVYACVEALVNRGWDETLRNDRIIVEVRVPFNWKSYYDNSIPVANVCAYDDYTTVVYWRVDAILGWLYDKGYSPFTALEFRKAIHGFAAREEQLDRYYRVATEESIIDLYSDIISDTTPSPTGRTLRGRQHYKSNWFTPKKEREKQETLVDNNNEL